MIRALKVLAIGGLAALLAACGGGGGNGGQTTGVEPLALQLFAISPASGTAPLQTSLTAVVSGGVAPYDYAWDFENDGSFDAFDNNKFDTTVSRQHQYNLRAADAGGASVYTAKVRITDAAGTVLTSDPATVTVNANVTEPPVDVIFIEDELGNQIDPAAHVFDSGERLRFHFGDSANFTYQWDFNFQTIDLSKPLDQQVTPANPTFTVESTAVNPSHVFYNTGADPLIYVVEVRVKDIHTGEIATHVFQVTVAGSVPASGDSTLEADIASNPPADATLAADGKKVITLRYDPTGNTPGVPTEPILELSAIVSQEPGKNGVPPYEFYWDFENDGKIDKAAESPTIPYYDSVRKVTVNPYLHNEDEHSFQVRLLAIDIKGHSDEVVEWVRSINVGNRPPAALSFTANWGFGTPPSLSQFTEVDGAADGSKTGIFTIVPKGATGFYEYKLDVDGDGKGDYDYVDTNADTIPDTAKLVPGADKWIPVGQTGVTINVPFGPHPDPDDPNTPPATVNQFPVPNYYAAQAIVRALDSAGGNQVDVMTRQLPVSLVQVGTTSSDTIDTDPNDPDVDQLPAIQDHQLVPFSQSSSYLISRGVVIVGGAQGTTALRAVTRITQTFNPPAQPGDPETLSGTLVEPLTPMTVARRGQTSFMFSDTDTVAIPTDPNSVIYSVGGRNPDVGPLASVEFMPFDLSATDKPWLLSGSEMNPTGSAYPLSDFGSGLAWFGVIPNIDANPHRYMSFAGGLNQPAKDANAEVSALTDLFVPFSAADPADDGWGTWSASLGVPRYDLSTVMIGSTMYAIGGRSSSGQSTATLEKFDLLVDNGWVQLPNMHDPRSGCCAEVIDPDGVGSKNPQIYVYGGAFFPGVAGNRTLVPTAEVYNPATQTWSYTLPPKTSSYAAASAAIRGPGMFSSNSHANSVWYYGGEVGQSASQGETNKLEEFVYFYNP